MIVVDYSLYEWCSNTAMSEAIQSTEKPWYEAFPPARCQIPASLSSAELLHALNQGEKPGVDFILVDLRRNDHDVGSPSHAILQD